MKLRAATFLSLLLVAGTALAVPAASVDSVQLPAWRVRGEQSEPLSPGMDVKNGDQIVTGNGARVYLKLAEGSTVKLGEQAKLNLYSRSLKPQTAFRGALDVLQGAFRFTAAKAGKLKSRDLTIRAGTASVGIRGTDLWGKPGREHDLIMLIEGRIEVKPAGTDNDEVILDSPLSVLLTFRGSEPPTLTHATAEELNVRAAETEILASTSGALRPQGRFSLRLGEVLEEEAEALALYDQVRSSGYPAQIHPVRSGRGKVLRYEVRLKGFASRKEAELAAGPIAAVLKLDATVTP